MTFKALCASSLLALCLGASPAAADKFTASQWLPPTYAQSIHAYKNMFDRLRERTGGAVDVETFYGASLLPAKTTITGVREGVADIGMIYPAYTPAELPVQVFLNNVNFSSTDSLASALAFTEMGFTDPQMVKEFDTYNVVFGGAYVTPPYLFLCNTEAKSAAQASGKRYRTAGSAFTGLTEALGGTAVSVPIGDAYSGMQRGSIDCIMADPTNLTTASFNEVVKNITTVPMGGSTGDLWVVRKDSWAKISEGNRKIMVDEMIRAMVLVHDEWARQSAASFADAEKRGIVVSEPDKDLSDVVAGFKSKFFTDLVANSKDVKNPQELMDKYIALQAKWHDLLKDVDRSDNDAVIKIAQDELYTKINLATYGMK